MGSIQPVKNKGKKRKKLSPADKYKKYWESIEKKKKRNEAFKKQVEVLSGSYSDKIQPVELERDKVLVHLTERLMSHLPKKSLTKWQRDLLVEWISENIKTLSQSANANKLGIGALNSALQVYFQEVEAKEREKMSGGDEEVEAMLEEEMEDMKLHELRMMFRMEMGVDIDELFSEEELSELIKNPQEFMEKNQARIHAHFEEQHAEHHEERQASEKEESVRTKKMFENTAIDRLYKKLAKVLHPDLVTCEEEKKNRHELMSQLVQAKKEHNLMWIIEKYNEYVDSDTIDFTEEDLVKINEMLAKKDLDMDQEHWAYQQSSPFVAWVSENLVGKTDKATTQKINSYLKEIRKHRNELEGEYDNTRTLKLLKGELEERYEDQRGEDMFAMLDNLFGRL